MSAMRPDGTTPDGTTPDGTTPDAAAEGTGAQGLSAALRETARAWLADDPDPRTAAQLGALLERADA